MKVYIGPYPSFSTKIKDYPERKIQVRIDKYDTWSMDHTLSFIIHPMLVQLKATKHGAPRTADEDVPEYLRSTSPPINEENTSKGNYEGAVEYETNLFAKWDWILDEMIWAFAQELDEDVEDKFYSGVAHHMFIPLDKDHKPMGDPVEFDSKKKYPGVEFWEMVNGPNHTFTLDEDGYAAFQERKQNGFRLFGVYFQNLWD